MFKNIPTKALVITGAILCGLMIAIALYAPYWKTDGALEDALRQVIAIDSPPAEMELDAKDSWGHPIVFRFSRDAHKLIYTVISKGPDGILDTADDRKKVYVDYNVSRMIGSWTAEKAKEFLKGVKEGIDKKSKYDAPEAEKK